MTIKEAIKYVEAAKNFYGGMNHGVMHQALNMAIDALREKENDEDDGR